MRSNAFEKLLKMKPNTFKNDAKTLLKSMPKPPKDHPKSRLGRLLNASRRGVGNKLEKRTSGIIELRGFWEPKTTPWSVLKGIQKPSKFRSFFYIIFTRFRWPPGSQHGSQNPRKSIKNRRPCPCLSWVPLGIRFSMEIGSKVNKAEERRRHFRSGMNTICTLSACSTSS